MTDMREGPEGDPRTEQWALQVPTQMLTTQQHPEISKDVQWGF